MLSVCDRDVLLAVAAGGSADLELPSFGLVLRARAAEAGGEGEVYPPGRSVAFSADVEGRTVIEAVFVMDGEGGGSFEEVWVSPDRRRRGLATALYDLVESMGVALRPSDGLDEDGFLFWEARRAFRTPR